MSPVFDCTTPEGLADALPKAAAGVREGRLVVLPTDTLYGVGADAFSPEAVQALLRAKGRDRDMPPPVLIGDVRTLDGLALEVSDAARALIERYWPGPLTVVLRSQPSLMWDLGDTGGTVAVRQPDDEVALALLRDVGPMAVSSANRTGYPASRTVVEAASQLGMTVDIYLDGGPARGGLASTIVDCTREEVEVLRVGAISREDIFVVVADLKMAPAEALQLSRDNDADRRDTHLGTGADGPRDPEAAGAPHTQQEPPTTQENTAS